MKSNVLSFLLLMLTGCSTTVQLTLKNETPQDLSVRVLHGKTYDSPEGMKEECIGKVPKDARMKCSKFNVDKADRVIVEGKFPNGSVITFDELIVQNEDIDREIPLMLRNAVIVESDKSSYQSIKNNLRYSPDYEYPVNKPAKDAFETEIGGLVLVDEGKVIDRIQPSTLKATNEPSFGNITNSFDFYFTRKFVTENVLSIPIIAALNYNFSDADLYKVRYSVANAGNVSWRAPQGKSIDQLFTALPENLQVSWFDRYLEHATSFRMYQITDAYVVEGSYVEIEKMRTSISKGSASSLVFTGLGAYEKSEQESFKQVVTPTVLAASYLRSDKTYLLAQGAKKYLEKNRKAVAAAGSDAQLKKILQSMSRHRLPVFGVDSSTAPVEVKFTRTKAFLLRGLDSLALTIDSKYLKERETARKQPWD